MIFAVIELQSFVDIVNSVSGGGLLLRTFGKIFHEFPGKTWTVVLYTNLQVGTICTSKDCNDAFARNFGGSVDHCVFNQRLENQLGNIAMV